MKLCSWPCHDGSGTQTPRRPSQLTETLARCTRPAPTQTRQGHSTEKGKRTQGPTPHQKNYLQLILEKGKLSFLQWSVTGYMDHPLFQACAWHRQCKSSSVGFCCCCLCVHVCVTSFYFVLFWLFFCYFALLLIRIFIFMFL